MHNRVRKERDFYFDFLKGILILLVLLGHAIQYGSGNDFLAEERYWDNIAMKTIYSFHMPLFAAVSGYFQYYSIAKGASGSSLLKRCKRLLLPVVFWSVVMTACKMVADGERLFVKSLMYTMVCDFWFIWAVLLGACLAYVMSRVYNRAGRLFLYALLMLLFLFTPDLFWVGAACKYVIQFYLLGYELASMSWHPRSITKRAMMLGTGVWMLLLLIYNKDCYIYTSLYSVPWSDHPARQLWADAFRNLIGVTGCFSFCGLVHWLWMHIRDGWLKAFLVNMGQQSLAIYVLSTPVYLYLIPKMTFGFSPSVMTTILITLAMAAFCSAAAKLLGKNKWVSGMLLGE